MKERQPRSGVALELDRLSARTRYKLLASLIVPRPIALVTTVNESGLVNAAPFSLFNMLGEDPPLVVVSVNKKEGGALKDTARNILRSREFVVNTCDEPIAAAMHASAGEFPPDVSEVALLGLEAQPSIAVGPPRLAAAPAAFECVLDDHLENASRLIFLGRVLWLHARQGLVDINTHRVDLAHYMPVGRFGGTEYVKTKDRFTFGRISMGNQLLPFSGELHDIFSKDDAQRVALLAEHDHNDEIEFIAVLGYN